MRAPADPGGVRAPAVRWADLRLRILSAAVLAPLALAGLWLGGAAWHLLVAAAAFGMGIEWLAMCGRSPRMPAGAAVLCALLFAVAAAAFDRDGTALALLAAGAALAWALARRAGPACGVLYVGLGALALIWLRDDAAAGRANLLFVVLIVWASDIGAYAVGRLVGGPRLAPAISPGKTWSGAVGGLLAAMAAGWLAGRLLDATGAPPLTVLAVAAALGITSQAGDLLESAVKRHFGVKDSGRLIPGHGGLLDRLDGVLTAAPAAALLALALGRGVVLWR